VRLENSFEVTASPETAWDLLMDVERVIPCMPGAELDEVIDDTTWKATMKVKLGPMSLSFATDVKREEADAETMRTRLTARAREARGRGAAQTAIESSLTAVNGGTRVDVVTDITLTGAVAQFGRGIVDEVASQIITRFAECIQTQLASAPAPEATAEAQAGASPEVRARPLSAVSIALGTVGRAVRRLLGRLGLRS
jgi:carbon monoxide dehydrogenase subunit G